MPQQATIPTKSKNALIVNCTWGNHLPTCLLLLLFRPLPRPHEKAIVHLFVGVSNMVISGYFRFGNTSSCRCSCSLAKGCNQCGSLVLLREFQTCVLILAVNVSIPMIIQGINYALRVVLSSTNYIALVL